MRGPDADAAARIIERLLADPAFRSDFRRDPAAACHAAGLHELAEEMSVGAGKAMQTLDIRESRSSLAGVMMAAAFEGVGLFEFAEHVVPGLASAPAAVHDVLSRVNLPAIGSAQGALAASPAQAAAAADPPPVVPADGAPGGAGAVHPAPAPLAPPATPEPAVPHAAEPDPVPEAEPGAADVPEPPAGAAGGGPSAEALALLDNTKVELDADAVEQIRSGSADPRVVTLLAKLAETHAIKAGHVGGGVDIAAVDGMPVNADNPVARDVATELGALDPSYRPDEIGSPWQIADPRYVPDSDRLHIVFKEQPPAGAGAPTAAPAGGTMALKAVTGASGRGDAANHSMALKSVAAADAPREPAAARVAAAGGAGAISEHVGKGVENYGAAGPKASAALKEALRYKGTPYLWGGSSPKTGFDCSGLVQWAYAKQGIQIPRVTDQQILATNGNHVARNHLEAGDLVFFKDPSGYVHHVGISMGGDRFLHAPHTGDVVKESSLKESYYAQQFAGGRRFDHSAPDAVAAPDPAGVAAAQDAHARDAIDAHRPGTLVFKALSRQESSNHGSTVRFLRAVGPHDAQRGGSRGGEHIARVAAEGAGSGGPLDYPGDNAKPEAIAAWMARKAEAAGLPRELPVMAALVESTLHNIQGGDRDSVGFFQMRLGIWNTGPYRGYPSNPDLQVKWFIDQALAVKQQRLGRGESGFLDNPKKWGEWVADVERPQENLRYKYQDQLEQARRLLRGGI
jgi:cell wall-associated NlpC family hydrolase